ncbi:hypothetical protein BKA62DRAFT_676524 [Auriculariales sp. MPI-PUGE-AT-0066]|nr:hypothetical protein BKA62DRAFT_676524 [Auriculariales sp. MPI-PUGE-AT-0066]
MATLYPLRSETDQEVAIARVQEETAAGALLCRPAGGRSPSAWELVMSMSDYLPRDSTQAVQYLAERLSEHDLEALVDALTGGESGIRLALADTYFFVSVVRHARIVSPNWWKKFRLSILALSDEQWGERKWPQLHATPMAFVDDIERLGRCPECTEAIQEFRERPKPVQDTSQVSDPHDSPAAVSPVIASDDIHPTESTAPSTAILAEMGSVFSGLMVHNFGIRTEPGFPEGTVYEGPPMAERRIQVRLAEIVVQCFSLSTIHGSSGHL